jgi:hypothetical protein
MKTSLASARASGRAIRRASAAFLVALLALAAATLGLAQTDNFNDGNDVGWTHYDPIGGLPGAPTASFTFPSGNTCRIAAPARPSAYAPYGQARAGALLLGTNYTDFYIEVDVLDWNNSIDQAFGILARITTPALGMTDGYAFTIQVTDTDISISRLVGEAPTDLPGSSKNFIPDPTKDYRMVFIGRGTHFIGRIYELPNLETPVITTEGDDLMFASGVNGLVIADLTSVNNPVGVGCDATFDNFRALAVEPPRLSIVYDRGLQYNRVSWPGTSTGFALQYATSLPATSWTTVPADQIFNPFEEPFPSDPDFKYFDYETTGNRFFRLVKQ